MATCDQLAPADTMFASVSDKCASEKQMQDKQQQTVQLMGRAQCHQDCQRVVRLLYASSVAPFVFENFWHSNDDYFPDVLLHLEFRCSRQNLPLLCRALEAFLQDLCDLSDMHVLTETLTFREEYTGQRLFDNGAQHRAEIALRFYDRVRSVA